MSWWWAMARLSMANPIRVLPAAVRLKRARGGSEKVAKAFTLIGGQQRGQLVGDPLN